MLGEVKKDFYSVMLPLSVKYAMHYKIVRMGSIQISKIFTQPLFVLKVGALGSRSSLRFNFLEIVFFGLPFVMQYSNPKIPAFITSMKLRPLATILCNYQTK